MKQLDLKISAGTDVGLKRPHNEDTHSVWIPDDPAERACRGVLIVVADGMGGSSAGEVASRLCAETVEAFMRKASGEDVQADLRKAIEEANRRVYEKGRSATEFNGMGTTCTVAVIRGDTAYVGHVGDSRAYLIRGEEIRQLTHDHSLVAHLVERRELTREQARRDPRRNVVTRSVGVGEEVEVDTLEADVKLLAGDRLMVCSDGLHGLMSDPEMADVIAYEDPSTVCAQLIAEANDRGGYDNITVVIARMGDAAGGAVLESSPSLHVATAGSGAKAKNGGSVTGVNPLLLVLFAASLALSCVLWLLNHQGMTL